MILEGITAKMTFEQKTCRKGEVEPTWKTGLCVIIAKDTRGKAQRESSLGVKKRFPAEGQPREKGQRVSSR